MAVFDESKIINALHPEKAEVGKKYWFADYILTLKELVEKGITDTHFCELAEIADESHYCFISDNESEWELLYPYEEPPRQRMTYRQLAEWMAKGNGEYTETKDDCCIQMFSIAYTEKNRDEPVKQGVFIRTWDSDEWVEPTVDIYERDCKGCKK